MTGLKDQYIKHLTGRVPEYAREVLAEWLESNKVILVISKRRKTKLGDYRPPANGSLHRISINSDLNQYEFLVTLVHEIAHLINWLKHKNKIAPHGAEWKEEYKWLMSSFISKNIFPPPVEKAIGNYMSNPSASSCTDVNLTKALRKYNPQKAYFYLEQIPENSIFKLHNGRLFKKGELLRKRFKCEELHSKKMYLFNPIAEIFPVNSQYSLF